MPYAADDGHYDYFFDKLSIQVCAGRDPSTLRPRGAHTPIFCLFPKACLFHSLPSAPCFLSCSILYTPADCLPAGSTSLPSGLAALPLLRLAWSSSVSPDSLPGPCPLQNGGNRYATVLTYLNDVEEGGETVFPNVPAPGGDNGPEFSECAR